MVFSGIGCRCPENLYVHLFAFRSELAEEGLLKVPLEKLCDHRVLPNLGYGLDKGEQAEVESWQDRYLVVRWELLSSGRSQACSRWG